LEKIAFYPSKLYTMDLKVVKNYIMMTDLYRSVTLLVWKEAGAEQKQPKLEERAKDYNAITAYSSHFVVKPPALGMLVCDEQTNVQVSDGAAGCHSIQGVSWRDLPLSCRCRCCSMIHLPSRPVVGISSYDELICIWGTAFLSSRNVVPSQ